MSRHPSRRTLLRSAGVAGLAGLAGCLGGGSSADTGAADATVRLTPESGFVPKRVTVAAGDTVRWVHEGTRMHSVTADEDRIPSVREFFASGGFDREIAARVIYPLRGGLTNGVEYGHSFREPGSYGYYSIPKEELTGTVIVEG